MKSLIFAWLFLLTVTSAICQVHVKGYYRKNGTYVAPYVRSSPDKNPYNNYSYPGNVNPYTGKVATGNPETYLQNYYNRSANKEAKYYFNDNQVISSGSYLKVFQILSTSVCYDIYDGNDIYNGYLIIYSDKSLKLYDKNRTFIKQVDNFNSSLLETPPIVNTTTSSFNPQSSTNSYNYNEPEVYYHSDRYLPLALSERKLKLNEKIYVKDKNGNYLDLYIVPYSVNQTVTKYYVYDHNDRVSGYVSEFVNGEIFIYNTYDQLIKHVKPPKQ